MHGQTGMGRKRLALALMFAATLVVPNLGPVGEVPPGLGVSPVERTPDPESALSLKPSGEAAGLEVPLSFEPNHGQAADEVLYLARGGGRTILLHADGFSVTEEAGSIRVRFLGGNPKVVLEGVEPKSSYTSYFMGVGESIPAVPHFGQVVYRGLYPGVDVLFYAASDGLPEFDVKGQVGADLQQVRLMADPGAALVLQPDGSVRATAPGFSFPLLAPVSYQESLVGRVPLPSKYQLDEQGRMGFALDGLNPAWPIVIDPKLGYSSYFGGASDASINGASPDSFTAVAAYDGSLYAVGTSTSGAGKCTPLAACPSAYNSAGNGIMVAKFDLTLDGPAGLKWVAVIIGGWTTAVHDIDVDSSGVYIVGSAYTPHWQCSTTTGACTAWGPNYYVTGNAYQTEQTNAYAGTGTCWLGTDAVLTKISLNGQAAPYSTFIGGSAADVGLGVSAGGGKPVIVGRTQWDSRQNFPVVNGFQAEHHGSPSTNACAAPYNSGQVVGTSDAFMARFDTSVPSGPLGSNPLSLVFSTLIGGSYDDQAKDVAVDGDGNIWATGHTCFPAAGSPSCGTTNTPASVPFPLKDGFQAGLGGYNAFVVKVAPNGGANSLLYGTLLGGSQNDYGLAIQTEGLGQGLLVFVGGSTGSSNFPFNAAKPTFDGSLQASTAGFLTIIDPSQIATPANQLVQSTFIETLGPGSTQVLALQVDDTGVYAEGVTSAGMLFPRLHAWPNLHGGDTSDLFVAQFSKDLAQLGFSTAVGSASADATGGHPGTLLSDALGTGMVVVGAPVATTTWPIPQSASNPGVPLPALLSFHRSPAGGREGVIARFVGPSEPYVGCGATGSSYRGAPLTFTWAPAGLPHTQGIETYDALAGGDPNYGMAIPTFRWDFDYDGVTFNPISSANGLTMPPHTYPTSAPLGPRTIMVQATDTDGRLGIGTCTVDLANRPPVAKCSVLTPPPFFPTQDIQLSSAASSDPDGSVATQAWSLDPDGSFVPPTSASAPNPTVKFPTTGTKQIELTIADNDGGGTVALRSIATSGSLWTAVGDAGSILTSTDLQNWTTQSSGTASDLRAIAYGSGQWVAVGENGVILTSPDALDWTRRGSVNLQDLHGVATSGALWVAVGRQGVVLTSPDGADWTPRSSGTTADLNGIAYASTGPYRWIAVGSGGSIRSSVNAISWIAQASGTAVALRAVAFQPTSPRMWTAVGEDGVTLNSPNGVDWTPRVMRSIVHGGSQWVAAGEGGLLLRSPDGFAWTLGGPGVPGTIYAIANSGTTWVAVGQTDVMYVSTDNGLSWNPASGGWHNHRAIVATSGTSFYRWVAVGINGNVRFSSDPAAGSWAMTTIGPAGLILNGVAYGDGGGGNYWTAVGQNGALFTSTNPTAWTDKSVGFQDLYAAASGDSPAAKWVVVGENGVIRYNLNNNPGAGPWSLAASATSQSLRSVKFADGEWTAVGDNGAIVTSLDGVAWSPKTSPTTRNLLSVSFGAGQWMALGDNGVLISSSGGPWSVVPTGTPNDLNGLATTDGLWVAVGDSGTVMAGRSPVFWGLSPIATQALHAAAAAPGGPWVAVGNSNTLKTSPGTAAWTSQSNGARAICRLEVIDPAIPLPTCSATSSAVRTGDPANLMATGGDGTTYLWSANGSTPTGGSGPVFVAQYAVPGNYTVQVTSAGLTAKCTLAVSATRPVECAPSSVTVPSGAEAKFMAKGGKSGFHWQAPAANPSTGSASGFNTSFRYGGQYVVTVISAGMSSTCQVTVVQPCGATAKFRASSLFPAPGQPVTFMDGSTGEIMGTLWEFGDGAQGHNPFEVHSFANAGAYVVRLTVIELGSNCKVQHEQTVIVAEPARQGLDAETLGTGSIAVPLAYAGPDLTVLEGGDVHIAGAAIGGNDGLTFHWRLVAGPGTVPVSHAGRSFQFKAPMLPSPEKTMRLTYELRVARGAAVSLPSTMQVTVLPADLRPHPDAGADAEVLRGSTIEINGTASSDPEGKPLTFAWRQIRGVPLQITGTELATPRLTVPTDAAIGTATFELLVFDGRWEAADTVLVTIVPLAPPEGAGDSPQSVSLARPLIAAQVASPWPYMIGMGVAAATTTVGILFFLRPKKDEEPALVVEK